MARESGGKDLVSSPSSRSRLSSPVYKLPNEIIEWIVSIIFARSDRSFDEVEPLSLVCRAWVRPAQHVIFRCLRVKRDGPGRLLLLKCFEESCVRLYVRSLRIWCGPASDDIAGNLPELFLAFPNVVHLQLEFPHPLQPSYSGDSVAALTAVLSVVLSSGLDLQFLTLMNFGRFTSQANEILSRCERLKEFSLHDTSNRSPFYHGGGDSVHLVPIGSFTSRIRSLAIKGILPHAALSSLPLQFTNLTRLSLVQEDKYFLAKYLKDLAPLFQNLTHLHFDSYLPLHMKCHLKAGGIVRRVPLEPDFAVFEEGLKNCFKAAQRLKFFAFDSEAIELSIFNILPPSLESVRLTAFQGLNRLHSVSHRVGSQEEWLSDPTAVVGEDYLNSVTVVGEDYLENLVKEKHFPSLRLVSLVSNKNFRTQSDLAEGKAVVERLTEFFNLNDVAVEVQVTDDAHPGFNVFEPHNMSDIRRKRIKLSSLKMRRCGREREREAEGESQAGALDLENLVNELLASNT
ncbi:hypothetical protein BT69DRAFT_1347295 [Atractiella rhizophila]|nr:hypothetical protein BT69DRAFT_1347295 [Atractiella rhizophila]